MPGLTRRPPHAPPAAPSLCSLRRPPPAFSPTAGVVGLLLLNVAALVVAALLALLSWWIPNAAFAHLVTGLAVHFTYIPLVAATIFLLACPAQQDRVTNASPIRRGGRGVSGHW